MGEGERKVERLSQQHGVFRIIHIAIPRIPYSHLYDIHLASSDSSRDVYCEVNKWVLVETAVDSIDPHSCIQTVLRKS